MSNADLQSIQAIFLEEMGELLQELEKDLLVLENSPGDRALVDRLFRNLHTIKGGAGMAGLEALSHYTHGVENMLDEVRKGNLVLTQLLASLLFEALDCLKNFMAEALGEKNLDQQRVENSRARIHAAMTGREVLVAAASAAVVAPAAPAIVVTTAADPVIHDINTYIIQVHVQANLFPSASELAAVVDALSQLGKVRLVSHEHSLPPTEQRQEGIFYLWRSAHLVTEADQERVVAALGEWPDRHRVVIDLLSLVPEAPENQAQIDAAVTTDAGPTPLTTPIDTNTPPDVATHPAATISSDISPPPDAGGSLDEVVPSPPSLRQKSGTGKVDLQSVQKLSSIRVDTGKLDKLVNLVGELITVEARLDSFQAFLEEKDTDLAEKLLEILDDSSRTLRELQDQAMTIRMVPIGSALDPMQRLVRDYCRATGKQIHLTIVGQETEVDKKVSEQISGPLQHLLRNALDHGIEPPAERTARGKPPEGRITLAACHQYGLIVIEVTDDGRGIDVERVVQAARQKGIIDGNRDLSERDKLELIFAPAVSTAAVVTEVSGRGVGMDVVKRDIEALRGTVEIASSPGQGTTITVRIPMTLAIVDGLLVCVGKYRYIIPLSSVEECVELTVGSMAEEEGSSFLDIRGDLVPFLRLRDLFNIADAVPPFEKVVIVSSGDRRVGLVVDHLLGDHQTVIKPLSPLHRNVQSFLGATILGDGGVVLILDVLHLIEFGQSREEQRRAP
ncbi:MAG: chemotaxis protein CheA [Magnetococcales bacterium]|nr:chemotaxis protein CheA [Magnetococcales bacterium]